MNVRIIARRLLLEREIEEQLDHVGFFLPLSEDLATQYPSREGDSSPAHITVRYIGAMPRSALEAVADVGRLVIPRHPIFKVTVGGVAEFTNADGEKVWHSMVESPGLVELNAKLTEALQEAGISFEETYPIFTPHVTLQYGGEYSGEPPAGSFEAVKIGLWAEQDEKSEELASFGLEGEEEAE